MERFMTTEKASKKWCPFIRRWQSCNRKSNDDDKNIDRHCLCISGECAVWVWGDKEQTEGYCGMVTFF